MPDLGPLLVILLFVGVSILRRVNKEYQTCKKAVQQTRASQTVRPAPQAFSESAPILQMPESKYMMDSEIPLEELKKRDAQPRFKFPDEVDPVYEGILKENAAMKTPVTKPRSNILPKFNRDSLVQAIITREVLSRPPGAKPRGAQGRKTL